MIRYTSAIHTVAWVLEVYRQYWNFSGMSGKIVLWYDSAKMSRTSHLHKRFIAYEFNVDNDSKSQERVVVSASERVAGHSSDFC